MLWVASKNDTNPVPCVFHSRTRLLPPLHLLPFSPFLLNDTLYWMRTTQSNRNALLLDECTAQECGESGSSPGRIGDVLELDVVVAVTPPFAWSRLAHPQRDQDQKAEQVDPTCLSPGCWSLRPRLGWTVPK